MPPLANPRREKFVQGLAEGLSGAESYRRAGYRGNGHSAEAAASTLLKYVEVQTRLGEIRERAAKRNEVTVDTLIDLEQARQAALASDPPQTSAAVAATMGMAKLTGLLVERHEVAVQPSRHSAAKCSN
jgi:phage terminase small subunit